MAGLTEGRNTLHLAGSMRYERIVASGSTVYAGSLVAQDASGNAVPASDTSGLTVLGRAENTASAGERVVIRTGKYLFDIGSGSEALTSADIGKTVFVVDDHTVGAVGGTNNIPAGILLDAGNDGAAVLIMPQSPAEGVADCTFAGSTATSAETTLNALLASLRSAGVLAAN